MPAWTTQQDLVSKKAHFYLYLNGQKNSAMNYNFPSPTPGGGS